MRVRDVCAEQLLSITAKGLPKEEHAVKDALQRIKEMMKSTMAKSLNEARDPECASKSHAPAPLCSSRLNLPCSWYSIFLKRCLLSSATEFAGAKAAHWLDAARE